MRRCIHTALHSETQRIQTLIGTFKQYGHLFASIDPLQLRVKMPDLHSRIHGTRLDVDDTHHPFILKSIIHNTTHGLITQG